MAINKEVFVKKFSNEVEIVAGAYHYFDFQNEANANDYLPFNKLRLFNKSSVEVWVWLDNIQDADDPDYIIGSGLGVDESIIEGVNFNTIILINKGAVSISANQFKGRIATVREG